ncbi:hypothetical protein [Burkholderia sp. IDO3]|uniref:hypothetical protein n=1 Tax=Burkholderia sp. IDO3 TaxID=1705310 RepID=UPI001177387E|nr:hypothetical protein [Burkholderia sp. IDO3]
MEEADKNYLSKLPDWLWAAIIGTIGVVLTGTDYFMGQSYYGAYLEHFHIDSQAFPLDRDTSMIYGAIAFLHAGNALLEWSTAHWKIFPFVILYFSFWRGIYLVAAKFKERKFLERPKKIVKSYPTLSNLAFSTCIFSLCLVMALWGIIGFGMFFSIPGAIGESVGRQVARQDQSSFDKGCITSKDMCFALSKGGVPITQGFKLAETKDRVVLYLNGATHDYSLADRDLDTVPKDIAPADRHVGGK